MSGSPRYQGARRPALCEQGDSQTMVVSEQRLSLSLCVLSEAESGLRGLIWYHCRTSLLRFAAELGRLS